MALINIKIPEKAKKIEDELLALISHEMKTPLHAILGFTELLLDESVGDLNEKQNKYLRGVYQNSQRLLSLINDMLDYSRISSEHIKLNPTEIGTYSFCEDVRTTVKPLFKLKRIKLVIESNRMPHHFIADKNRMKQVLVNLLNNASKFSSFDTEVIMRVFENRNNDIVFEITDNGTGIDEYELDLIFNPFYQSDNSDSRQNEGAGLGLAITKNIIIMHGGKIEVDSKLGAGSTFRITIPNRMKRFDLLHNNYGWDLLRDLEEADPVVLIFSHHEPASDELENALKTHGYRGITTELNKNTNIKIKRLNPILAIVDLSNLSSDAELISILTFIRENVRGLAIPIYATSLSCEFSAINDLKAIDLSIFDAFIEKDKLAESINNFAGNNRISQNNIGVTARKEILAILKKDVAGSSLFNIEEIEIDDLGEVLPETVVVDINYPKLTNKILKCDWHQPLSSLRTICVYDNELTNESKLLDDFKNTLTLCDGCNLIDLINDLDHESATTNDGKEILSYSAFRRQLSKEISRAKRTKENLSIVTFEINELKRAKLGTKDLEFLDNMYLVFKNNLRDYDYLAKHSPAGFSIILPSVDLMQRKVVVSKLKEMVEYYLEENELNYSSKFGYASFPKEANTIGILLRVAFERLYGERND